MKYTRHTTQFILIILILLLYAFILLRNAWLCDDAYITLRVADNFIHGYGLTWNIIERVQVYTHPLWLFLMTTVYTVTREAFFTMIFTSVTVSLAAVMLYVVKVARTTLLAVIGTVTLTLSSAFVDYSTSGLENPLTFLILAAFLYVYFKKEITFHSLFILSLIAALGALNRMDILVLYLPMLIFAFWKVRSGTAAVRVFLGFLPLILWMIFSLFYYGFLFPNTAYAKLNTGLPAMWLIQHGGFYLYTSLLDDPLTIIILAAALIIPLFRRKPIYIMTSLGILLYLAYIVKIGGCYMAGRHLAAPLFAGVMLLSQYRRPSKFALVPLAIIILAVGLFNSRLPVYASEDETSETFPFRYGITDERSWLTPTHSLMNNIFGQNARLSNDWANEGRTARENNIPSKIGYAIGMIGYYGGPQVNILDVNALSDPLLARLPVSPYHRHRVGHFTRIIPTGYKRTNLTGQNHINDPALSEYYDKIALITRGELFDLKRIREIIKLNIGWYDHLVEEYLSPHLMQVNLEDISEPRRERIIGDFANNHIFYQQGLQIDLGRVYHASRFELCRDHNRGQRLELILAGQKVASRVIPAAPISRWGLATLTVSVPSDAVKLGYDMIKILPEGTYDGYQSIGHLIFLNNEGSAQDSLSNRGKL